MSRLAPGRKHDMEMLLDRRARAPKYSDTWNKVQLKIEDLIEEGRCNSMHSLRYRLVNASRASDNDEIIKISKEIDQHVKIHHPRRHKRAWIQKG